MSWLFSQALVSECLGRSCTAGELYAPSSVTHTARPFWLRDKTTVSFVPSLFGQTSNLLTADRGAELLTSFLAGFHVKTYHPQDVGAASTAPSPDCGGSSPESSRKCSRRKPSSKTPQIYVLADLSESSKILPPSGMLRGGVCFPLPAPEPGTYENERLFLPTVTVTGNNDRAGASATSGDGLATALARGFAPTPTATEYGSNQGGAAGRTGKKRPSLRGFLSTVRATDGTRGGKGINGKSEHGDLRLGGPLNPPWIEWFMGCPIGWTALEPLEMDKFLPWLLEHIGP